MQHINNIMVELFRKAAKDYPLKISSDWNAVLKKLSARIREKKIWAK